MWNEKATSEAALIEATTQCVACGLCVPHCPSYTVAQRESFSPRGRIMLTRAVLAGQLAPDADYQAALNSCLSCGACEAVCPNQVPYTAMRTAALARFAPPALKPANRLLLRWAQHPKVWERLAPWLRHWRYSRWLLRHRPLAPWLKRNGFDTWVAQLPHPLPPAPTWKSIYPAQGREKAQVQLFLGCVARALDTLTLQAAVWLLNRLGVTVHIPPQQGCCGALHHHQGHLQTSYDLARNNQAAFQPDLPLLSTASGCGAQLARHLPQHQDIITYLAECDWSMLTRTPLTQPIWWHLPCSQRNGLGEEKFLRTLLSRLEAPSCEPLPENTLCCGGAGLYSSTHPHLAQALQARKLAQLSATSHGYLLTSNLGCGLWLAQGLRARGMRLQVCHPVVLLAWQAGWLIGTVEGKTYV